MTPPAPKAKDTEEEPVAEFDPANATVTEGAPLVQHAELEEAEDRLREFAVAQAHGAYEKTVTYMDAKTKELADKLNEQIETGMKDLADQLSAVVKVATGGDAHGFVALDVEWLVKEAQHLGQNISNLVQHLHRATGTQVPVSPRPEGHPELSPSAQHAADLAAAAATELPESGADPGDPAGLAAHVEAAKTGDAPAP